MADMRRLEGKHYFLIGGFLTSLSVQLAGVKHGWSDVLTPLFVSGVLAQLAVLLGAVYSGAPGATGEKVDRRDPYSHDPDGIKDPSRLTILPWLLAASLLGGSAVAIPACAKMPGTITTTAGKHAYTTDQWVERLREISNVVKGATPAIIAPADAFTIIEWISGDEHAAGGPTIGILQAIGSTGRGDNWRVTAKLAWEGRVKPLFRKYPNLAMYADVIDELLKAVL